MIYLLITGVRTSHQCEQKNKRKKKRKIGGQKRHPKYSRPLFEADEIDKTIIHKIPDKEVRRRGLLPLNKTESALQSATETIRCY